MLLTIKNSDLQLKKVELITIKKSFL